MLAEETFPCRGLLPLERTLRLALVKERDELRADAERFRWMRANLTRLVVATQGGDAPRKKE